jgi:hypothetical protein
MTWVKLDDAFADRPEVALLLDSVGPSGPWMHVAALCWCNTHTTDGKIPGAKVKQLVAGVDGLAVASELVRVKLWKRCRGGFEIRDYLVDQPSAAEVADRRRKATERKRKSRAGHAENSEVSQRDKTVTLVRAQPRAGSGRVRSPAMDGDNGQIDAGAVCPAEPKKPGGSPNTYAVQAALLHWQPLYDAYLEELRAFVAQHFPGVELGYLALARAECERRKLPATPENLRAHCRYLEAAA